MTLPGLLQQRLANQQITRQDHSSPAELVGWMGAVQSQDYTMAKFAIGLRLPKATDAGIEKALDNGTVIRTHILRPTWHFVAAEDIHWMMQLTAPHIKRVMAGMQRRLELDAKLLRKAYRIITRSLSEETTLTRQELMAHVNKAGIATDSLRAAHILAAAELDALVCSGPMKNKKFSYALLDQRVPSPQKKINRQEALTKLATKYFSSHGPATIYDFAWWSGLNLTEIKSVTDFMRSTFIAETIDGQAYWFRDPSTKPPQRRGIQLLPAFDEFMVGYRDRSASLPQAYTRQTITANGIFRPVILVNGKTEGLWQALKTQQGTNVKLQWFRPSPKLNKKSVAPQLKKIEAFFGRKIKLL